MIASWSRTVLGAAVVVGLWAGSAAPAEAGCCSCAWSASRTYSGVTVRKVNLRIDRMETNLVRELRLQSAQLSGYIATAAESTGKALDAQTKLLAQIAREEAETRSKLGHRPTRSGCETVTGMRGLRTGREVGEAAADRGTEVEAARIAGDKAVLAESGRNADARRRFGAWTGKYCSNGRAAAGGGVCKGEDAMHGADLKPGSLLDVRTFAGDGKKEAAEEFGRNIAAPVVWDAIPLRAVDTPEDERTALLLRSADARSLLAADWFSELRGRREAATDLGAWAAALAPGAGVAGDISRYELLEILASRRFEDPQWALRLQEMTTEQLLRESLMMQAASLMVQWDRYRQDERRGSMEAARLAIAAEEMRRLPGLAEGLSVIE